MPPSMPLPQSRQSPPFSPEQLLAFPLLPPPPSLPLWCFNLTGMLPTDRRDSTSSKNSQDHDAIALRSLVKTDDSAIVAFRSFVRSMSPAISFPTSLMLPVGGRSMNGHGDVVSYLNLQVIIAGWQTFLQMIPAERTYDPLTARQHPIEVHSSFLLPPSRLYLTIQYRAVFQIRYLVPWRPATATGKIPFKHARSRCILLRELWVN